MKDEEFCINNDELCIKNDELCIKNDEFCIKNDEFCINNDEFCIKNDEFCIKRCILALFFHLTVPSPKGTKPANSAATDVRFSRGFHAVFTRFDAVFTRVCTELMDLTGEISVQQAHTAVVPLGFHCFSDCFVAVFRLFRG